MTCFWGQNTLYVDQELQYEKPDLFEQVKYRLRAFGQKHAEYFAPVEGRKRKQIEHEQRHVQQHHITDQDRQRVCAAAEEIEDLETLREHYSGCNEADQEQDQIAENAGDRDHHVRQIVAVPFAWIDGRRFAPPYQWNAPKRSAHSPEQEGDNRDQQRADRISMRDRIQRYAT